MKGRRFRAVDQSRTAGLTDGERLTVLEGATFGEVGLEQQVELLRRRVEDAESAIRRLQLPWVLRVLGGFRRKGEARDEQQALDREGDSPRGRPA